MGTLSDLPVANRLLLSTRSLKTLHTACLIHPFTRHFFVLFLHLSAVLSIIHCEERLESSSASSPRSFWRARPMNDQTSLRVLQTNQVSRNYNVMLILSPASSLPSQFSCYVFDVMLFWKFCSCSLVFLCCLVAFISAHCISPQFHSCPCAVLLLMVTALMLPRVRNLKHFIKNISWGTYDNNCCDN